MASSKKRSTIGSTREDDTPATPEDQLFSQPREEEDYPRGAKKSWPTYSLRCPPDLLMKIRTLAMINQESPSAIGIRALWKYIHEVEEERGRPITPPK